MKGRGNKQTPRADEKREESREMMIEEKNAQRRRRRSSIFRKRTEEGVVCPPFTLSMSDPPTAKGTDAGQQIVEKGDEREEEIGGSSKKQKEALLELLSGHKDSPELQTSSIARWNRAQPYWAAPPPLSQQGSGSEGGHRYLALPTSPSPVNVMIRRTPSPSTAEAVGWALAEAEVQAEARDWAHAREQVEAQMEGQAPRREARGEDEDDDRIDIATIPLLPLDRLDPQKAGAGAQVDYQIHAGFPCRPRILR